MSLRCACSLPLALNPSPNRVTLKKDRDWDEWQVITYKNNKKVGSYHTDDKEDAIGTMKLIREQLQETDPGTQYANNPWWRSKRSIFRTGPAVRPSHVSGPYSSRCDAERSAPVGFVGSRGACEKQAKSRRRPACPPCPPCASAPVETFSERPFAAEAEEILPAFNPCGCSQRYNPELLIVRNCGRRCRANPSRGKVRLVLGRTSMRRRRKSRNPGARKTIRFKGRKIGFKGLVRRLGVKKAVRVWRKSKKYLGRCRIHITKRRRKSSRRKGGRRRKR